MKEYVNKWKTDYNFKTVINSVGSFLITLVFALYNGFLGLRYRSVWNGGVCVYYILLVLLRGIILYNENISVKKEKRESLKRRCRTFRQTAVMLILMNVSLSFPAALMVYNKRPVNMGMIPAIAVASYTTYKVTMASINIKRVRKISSVLIRELRVINFIDALISLLTLQNTLITVNGGGSEMFVLTAVSSAGILLAAAVVSAWFIVKEIKSGTV